MSDNVVYFPIKSITPQTFDIEDINEVEFEQLLKENCESIKTISDHLTAELYQMFWDLGIDVESQEFQLDFALVESAISSAVCRDFGMPHELQEVVDKLLAEGAFETTNDNLKK